MQDCIVYLVTYEGQSESVYTWVGYSYHEAEQMKGDLERQFPTRKWDIYEKDVS